MGRRLLLVAATALALAPGAWAHATPIATSPANGSVLASAPLDALVTFDSGVRTGAGNAAIRNDGIDVLAGKPRVVGGRQLVLPLRRGLARGDYTVRWSVVSEDGHEEEGVIAFAVGSGSPAPTAALHVRGYVTWQRILMRTAFFLGVLGSVGAAFFSLVLLRALPRAHAHLLFVSFLLAFAGADALSHTAGAAGTRFARVLLVATIASGIGAAAAALAPRVPHLRYATWAAALVLFPLPTLAGHALDPDQPRVVAPVADLVHIGGAAVWVGGVAALVLSRALLPRFAPYAFAAVVLVAAGGLARALTELSSVSQLWSTSYGRALLVKSALFAAAVAIGRLRLLRPELVLFVGLAVAIGTLTDLRPGRERALAAAVAPAPLRLPPPGAYVDSREAGTTAVALAYLDGVATITLEGPDGGATRAPVTIDGRTPQSCGTGCFRARARRAVTVTVAGAPLHFTVPAQLRSGAVELRRATAAYDALRSVTVRERLASSPGVYEVTVYRQQAPDRLAFTIVGGTQRASIGSQSVVIGARRWDRRRGGPWIAAPATPLAMPKPFWSSATRNAFVSGPDEITFFDPSFPAWFRLRFDPHTARPLVLQMTGASHFMVHRYSGFDASAPISPPSR